MVAFPSGRDDGREHPVFEEHPGKAKGHLKRSEGHGRGHEEHDDKGRNDHDDDHDDD
ncbi:MAG: hypothetical protein H0V09_09230 [Gemmatimonadetes bacterium]|nr:hypothetical protein [Gemmatimonadota bacterium]